MENNRANDREDKMRLVLFDNTKDKLGNTREISDRAPTMTGTGEISREAMKRIVDRLKKNGGESVQLECALWEKVSKTGNPNQFVIVDVQNEEYMKKDKPVEEDFEDVPF